MYSILSLKDTIYRCAISSSRKRFYTRIYSSSVTRKSPTASRSSIHLCKSVRAFSTVYTTTTINQMDTIAHNKEGSDECRKRAPGGVDSNPKKKKNNNNKRSNFKKNHTRREEGDYGVEDNPNDCWSNMPDRNSSKHLHDGSFAHQAMRDKFCVTFPSHLLPPEQSSSSPPQDEIITNGKKDEEKNEPRLFSKKKVAFLLAYVGKGYAGFQMNKEQLTLQSLFEAALVRSELISPLNFGYPHKYSWSTSGRTDKGVHACAQVCSAKIQMLPEQSMDDVRDLINKHLPEDFRVLDAKRVTRKFCAKTGRSKVRYQYMIPSFCFFNRDKLRKIMEEKAPVYKEGRSTADPLSDDEAKEIQSQLKSYRISEEQKEALQNALEQYEGTHSFHNLAKGVRPGEARANRYIVSFKVEEPIIVDGIEWIPTQVVGQSFLLNQIRKMVSLAIDTVRFPLKDIIHRALQKNSDIKTSIAPAQGLFLEMSFYDHYNQRQENAQVDYDDLDWHSEDTPAFRRWKEFRNDIIMKHVVQEEEHEGNFVKYLYCQEFYFEYETMYQLENKSE